MTALYLLADHFRAMNLDDLVVVSPDVGRVKLNSKFAERIGAGLALMTKERPAHQEAEIGYVIGDVEGKTALIVDDIIDTAGTLTAAGQTVLDAGAKRVFAAARTPCSRAPRTSASPTPPFERVVVTDTIPLREGAPDKIETLSIAGLLADAIEQVFTHGSSRSASRGLDQVF